MTPNPDWRAIIDDGLFVQPRRIRRSIAVNYPNSLFGLVLEAAKQRRMSMTAYQRRASLAFAEWDLGFDWLTEMLDEPAVTSFVGRASTEAAGLGDYGPWRILDLRQHGA